MLYTNKNGQPLPRSTKALTYHFLLEPINLEVIQILNLIELYQGTQGKHVFNLNYG